MKRQKGYLLIYTMLLLAALFFFAVNYLRHYYADRSVGNRVEENVLAEEAAIAGIEQALYQVGDDHAWHPATYSQVLQDSKARFQLAFEPNQGIPASTNNWGNPAAVNGSGQRLVPAGTVHLVSVGTFGTATHQEECLVEVMPALWDGALFAAEQIELRGLSYTDSYDSRQGPYSQSNAGRRGDVGTNAFQAGTVYLANADLRGNIVLGPGATENTTIRVVGNGRYDGLTIADTPRDLPPAPVPPTGANLGDVDSRTTVLSPGVYRNLTIRAGANLELLPGAYLFTGNIEMQSRSTLTVTGRTRIHLLGDLSIQANSSIVGSLSAPPRLVLYGGELAQNWDFQGLSSTQLGLVAYAPHARMQFGGNTDFFGALVADRILSNGGARFHYDVSTGRGLSSLTVRSRW